MEDNSMLKDILKLPSMQPPGGKLIPPGRLSIWLELHCPKFLDKEDAL